MSPAARWWGPAALLLIGALFIAGIDTQRSLPLRGSLADALPREFEEFTGRDVPISAEEARASGVTDYVLRNYEPREAQSNISWVSLYVAYYDHQSRGKSIHSPKNCLPGGGWETLKSEGASIQTPLGLAPVNRYVLQSKSELALVLYWYQGRGRVRASEYAVKWDLLRDAALRRRSDESLVRIVVPIEESEDVAFDQAVALAQLVIPALNTVLPD